MLGVVFPSTVGATHSPSRTRSSPVVHTCTNASAEMLSGVGGAASMAESSLLGGYSLVTRAVATSPSHVSRTTSMPPSLRGLRSTIARAVGQGTTVGVGARAARDEVRHTTMMRALAEVFGGECAEVEVETPKPRAVLAMALENAREGCVGETHGAAQGAFQARRASDPRVRATLAVIARDEARHAELAWAVDAFLAPLLTADERREVERAREEAWAALEASLRDDPSEELRTVAGLPNAREAAWLVAGVRDVLAAA